MGFVKKGFTLIEVVIVISIFTLGILTVYGAFSYVVSLTHNISARFTAAYLVQEGLEVVRNLRDQNFIDTVSGAPEGVSLGAEIIVTSPDYDGVKTLRTAKCDRSDEVITAMGYYDSTLGNTDAVNDAIFRCSRLEADGTLTHETNWLSMSGTHTANGTPLQWGQCPSGYIWNTVYQKEIASTDLLDGVYYGDGCIQLTSTGLTGGVTPVGSHTDLNSPGNSNPATSFVCPSGSAIVGFDFDKVGVAPNTSAVDSVARLYCRPVVYSFDWSSGLVDGACADGCMVDYKTTDTDQITAFDSSFLKLNSDGFYGYDSGIDTIYKRKITIRNLVANQGQGIGNPYEDIIDVVAEVTWTYKGKSYSYSVNEYLYNWY